MNKEKESGGGWVKKDTLMLTAVLLTLAPTRHHFVFQFSGSEQ